MKKLMLVLGISLSLLASPALVAPAAYAATPAPTYTHGPITSPVILDVTAHRVHDGWRISWSHVSRALAHTAMSVTLQKDDLGKAVSVKAGATSVLVKPGFFTMWVRAGHQAAGTYDVAVSGDAHEVYAVGGTTLRVRLT